ncbi:MAG: cation transporter [Chloroflexi bacterium]|nr:MAG: cation transporter [Chloroflexota bacterium]
MTRDNSSTIAVYEQEKERAARPVHLPPMTQRENQRVIALLLVNISLAILWYIFLPVFGAPDYLVGFSVGALALTVYERAYGQRIWWLLSFIGFVLWEIVVSNAKLAWWILQPRPQFSPGIVAVPLSIDTDLEIIILATVITLTPGTVSIDLSQDDHGQNILYVHSFVVKDPDHFRHEVREMFERRLSLVTRGGWG